MPVYCDAQMPQEAAIRPKSRQKCAIFTGFLRHFGMFPTDFVLADKVEGLHIVAARYRDP
jgi:hypothetical protein